MSNGRGVSNWFVVFRASWAISQDHEQHWVKPHFIGSFSMLQCSRELQAERNLWPSLCKKKCVYFKERCHDCRRPVQAQQDTTCFNTKHQVYKHQANKVINNNVTTSHDAPAFWGFIIILNPLKYPCEPRLISVQIHFVCRKKKGRRDPVWNPPRHTALPCCERKERKRRIALEITGLKTARYWHKDFSSVWIIRVNHDP